MEAKNGGEAFLDDKEIIELYFKRDDSAIAETDKKYGGYCLSIAKKILRNTEDSEECLSSAFFTLWNLIPPEVPKNLGIFSAKITRNLAISALRRKNAFKRSGNMEIFDELSEFIASNDNIEDEIIAKELEEKINLFVKMLPEKDRNIFIRRYFFFESTNEIAEKYGFSQNGISVSLHRTRKKLKTYLEKEGYCL